MVKRIETLNAKFSTLEGSNERLSSKCKELEDKPHENYPKLWTRIEALEKCQGSQQSPATNESMVKEIARFREWVGAITQVSISFNPSQPKFIERLRMIINP